MAKTVFRTLDGTRFSGNKHFVMDYVHNFDALTLWDDLTSTIRLSKYSPRVAKRQHSTSDLGIRHVWQKDSTVSDLGIRHA